MKISILLAVVAVAILLPLLAGCSPPARPQSLDERAQEIYRSLMCPLCPGQTIEQSQTELSAQMRAIVREKLERGESKEQILEFFVERYGESVLAEPAKSGFNLVAWLAPVAGMVIGGVILWVVIRKWARKGKKSASEPGMPAADVTGDEKYHRRLEEELKDFDKGGFR